jgi:hypothetical protein
MGPCYQDSKIFACWLGISIAIRERCGYGHSDVGADVPITTAICSMSGQLDTW